MGESVNVESTLQQVFMEDLRDLMLELGFESRDNSVKLLAGLAMGSLNNDPRFVGADKAKEAVFADPLKSFPAEAALIFRAITGLVGMLNEQQTNYPGVSLMDGKTLVEMFEPFLH